MKESVLGMLIFGAFEHNVRRMKGGGGGWEKAEMADLILHQPPFPESNDQSLRWSYCDVGDMVESGE